jgi:adenosylmethionine-8-amino-7-oxononanoate aminotransferase
MTLLERDQKFIWHPYTHVKFKDYLTVDHAKGSYIYTSDGKKIFDAISSWWLVTHGHSYEPIIEAIRQQISRFSQVIFAGFTHESAVDLAELLLNLLPDHCCKVFFSDNGSTAVEIGIKMALQYFHNIGQKRNLILALEGAYHGDTFGAMSVSGKGVFTTPFEDLLFEVQYIPVPTAENIANIIDDLQNILQKQNVCAFIAEPLVQGAGGMMMYEAKYLDQITALIQQSEAFFIADEVMTGFGRLGKMFATDHLTIKPDIICLSKGITGGFLPLGATVVNQKIVDVFNTEEKSRVFFHGHSFTGNALSCSAALANVREMVKEDSLSKIKNLTEFQQTKADKLKLLPNIRNIRSMGTILAFDGIVADAGYLSDLKERVYRFGIQNEVLIRPLGNVIYVMPPYGTVLDDLEQVYQVIQKGIETNWQ